MTDKLLAMFPGQGSQSVGMGRDLVANFSSAKLAFEEAEDGACIKIRKLCFDGPESDLALTANTQPAILAVSIAIWRVLKEETGLSPTLFAGHSLGEYSAVVAAGGYTLAQAAMLVRRRGEAMQTAVPAGKGAMAAIIGATADQLADHCRQASSSDAIVEIVNFNSPTQLVVAGHLQAVNLLTENLGKVQIRAVSLPVSAPFHSRLMAPAREQMTPLLTHEPMAKVPGQVIIPNLTGTIAESYSPDFLVKQIDSPVQWTKTLETASAAGLTTYLEIGPGKVLFGLARRTLAKSMRLLHTEDITATIQALNA
jgi:[acyl-carrier-protein] S-malonyltransferase